MKKMHTASLIISLFLTVGVQTGFRACEPAEDGHWMNCHNAQVVVFGIGIALAALALIGMLLKKNAGSLAVSAASAVLAVIAIAVPGGIVPMCMMETMHCYTHLKPFVTVFRNHRRNGEY